MGGENSRDVCGVSGDGVGREWGGCGEWGEM